MTRLVRAAVPLLDPVVVSAVPWAPVAVPIPEWRRIRRIPPHGTVDGVEVHYPRVPGGLTHYTHALDAHLAFPFVRRLVLRLHAERPFSCIHAHFIYTDGVIASRLGAELGIPVVTTEHAHWQPWLDTERRVREQVLHALPGIRTVTAVSEATRQTIRNVAGASVRVELLPNVLDESAFPPPAGEARVPGRILFVGNVRKVKGLDVLVRAMTTLQQEIPDATVQVIGSSLSAAYRRDEGDARRLAASLDVAGRITFLGHRDPAEVSAAMREASVVAVPSRRESFSAVTIEALASGTPVVATRCGGPEELLDDSVGRLVAVDDPVAMARALAEVLRDPRRFDAATLRARVLPRFGIAATTERLRTLYAAGVGEGA